MGSLPKQEDEVKCVVTGFSRFHGVEENPTEELVTALPAFWTESCSKDGSCLFECATLKVSAEVCDQFLAKMAKRVTQELTGKPVVWIHLGVDPGAKEIAVESQAVNNASFLSPDEDGIQLMFHNIDDQLPYDAPILTKLNIDHITQRLRQMGVHLQKSFDAGRYICNWIYFRSLRQAELLAQPDWYTVFVHVPPFQHIPIEKQLHDIAALIGVICDEVKRPTQLSSAAAPS